MKSENPKVLLIDDDELFRAALSMFLEGEGFQATALETAEQGLEILEKEVFDLILCDYFLPGMDGLEFFSRIHRAHPTVPKLLMTAFEKSMIAPGVSEARIDGFIQKPLSAAGFEEILAFSGRI